jgi:hypothetical protein
MVSASSQGMAVDVGGPMAGSCVPSRGKATMKLCEQRTPNGTAPVRPAMKMVAMTTSRSLAHSVMVTGISKSTLITTLSKVSLLTF